ncbi:MAG: homoserine O-succinyltransferase [Thaumarchaeota archaeon]|nr:homoserine O-succinyltransferase [Nitrososphaerota archaeon]
MLLSHIYDNPIAMPTGKPSILVVGNYAKNPSRVVELFKSVKDILGADPALVWYKEIQYRDVDRFDGMVLSGSEAMLSHPDTQREYSQLMAVLRRYKKPILGICYGHQLLGAAFEGHVKPLGKKIEGFRKVKLLRKDILFEGLPDSFDAAQSHSEIVESVMPGFIHLAEAEEYPVEAFRHKDQPVYGVQFHPERSSKEHPLGVKVLSNFIRIVQEAKT